MGWVWYVASMGAREFMDADLVGARCLRTSFATVATKMAIRRLILLFVVMYKFIESFAPDI